MTNIIEMRGIKKYFGEVKALDSVDFTLCKGEIHALLGENGAGKTTLMNVLYGLYSPEDGEVIYNGKKEKISNPLKAIKLGIGMVHQHFMLIDTLTAYENIILGCEETKYGFLQKVKSKKAIEKLIHDSGLNVDLDKKVSALPIGVRQRIEIIKALYKGANVLILDEPTAVLTPQETDELFEILKKLKAAGTSIVIITHKMRETFAISDRVTVMRKGKVVVNLNVEETDPEELAMYMVGRDVNISGYEKGSSFKEVSLRVENISTNNRNSKNLCKVNFKIKRGEIFGIAGVDGNGQSLLSDILIGVTKPTQGKVVLNEVDITELSPSQRMELGVAVIPEDRNVQGLVGNFNVTQNLLLGRQRTVGKHGFLNWKLLTKDAQEKIDEFNIMPPIEALPAKSFSGGNQQKIVIARELSEKNINLIIAIQPTRGLDIGAIDFVHRELIKKRDEGAAVLLISTELDEIRRLSDRLAVIYEGKFLAEGETSDFTERDLGLYMAGKNVS